RPVRVVRDDGVEVADQHDPLRAGPLQAADQIRRMALGRAGHALGLRLGRQEGDAERYGLLRAGDVSRGRRDPYQRLELALGDEREPLRRLDHSGPAEAGGSAACAPMAFAKWKDVMRMPVFR